jgi:hypothetical protein
MNINEVVENFKPAYKKLVRKIELKPCSKCKELKLKTEFNKQTGNKDGLQVNCRACYKVAYEKTIGITTRKVCGVCKELKLKTEFNKRERTTDGLQNYCRVCNKAAVYEKTIERKHKKMINLTYENMIDITTWKVCSVCKELKLKTEFNKRTVNKDGLQTYCRVCKNL